MDELIDLLKGLDDRKEISLEEITEEIKENPSFFMNNTVIDSLVSFLESETIGSHLEEVTDELARNPLENFEDSLEENSLNQVTLLADFFHYLEVPVGFAERTYINEIEQAVVNLTEEDSLGAGNYLFLYNTLKKMEGEFTDDFI